MRASLARPDAVHEGRREEPIARRRRHSNRPAVVRALGHDLLCSIRLRVVHQRPTLDRLAIPRHLHLLTDRHREIVDTALDQAHHILGDAVLEPEAREVRRPRQSNVGLGLTSLDLRRLDLGHVVRERLRVLELATAVHDRHLQLLREDIDELDSIPVLAPNELLLVLVVVGRGQELAEDELGNPDLVLGMLSHIDRIAVVLDRDRGAVAGELDVLDGRLALPLAQSDHVVVGVDQELVDELEEAGVDLNPLALKCAGCVCKPHLLLCGLHATDVGVREGEDVLTMRLLLVGLGEIHSD